MELIRGPQYFHGPHLRAMTVGDEREELPQSHGEAERGAEGERADCESREPDGEGEGVSGSGRGTWHVAGKDLGHKLAFRMGHPYDLQTG